ncbi:MAG: UDP-glucose 6-dehydrogenase [Alphaproteobacteria bacterium 43-37]|nr:MAG: UDP-glucose 6-dehydrogenase [Alphaproteobacteria bacterium 43-37]
MKLTVIGTGYVGLVSGACFAEFGVDVTCVDKDKEKIHDLEKGIIPIFEPGLDELVHRNAAQGRLSFSTDLKHAVATADVVMIAVGTPMRAEDSQADLSYVFSVTKEIAESLSGYTIIATKSTVPAGTGTAVKKIITEINPNANVDVVSNPEFLREGSAIEDFMRPDRVVIGVESEKARELMKQLYRPLYLNETPMVFVSLETAELIKYASNAFLATKISFINQIADLCEKCGADVQDVAKGMGLDRRIGSKFLHASPGYGGSCFPKDTIALAKLAQNHGTPMSIVESVHESNLQRPIKMVQKIIDAFGGSVNDKTISVLGVTFKPNTDDMRESPSLRIIPILQERGATIKAYDPAGMEAAEAFLPGVMWCSNAYQTMEESDGVVILTEWNEFRALDLEKVKSILNQPLMIDLRNIYKPNEAKEAGFTYYSIGRSVSDSSSKGDISALKASIL